MSDPDSLTPKELAERLRMDRKSLYQAFAAGEIPGVRKIGKVYRAHWPTVEKWWREGTGQ